MRKDALAKCLRRWYSNAYVLRKARHAVWRLRHLLAVKAFATWCLHAAALHGVKDFVLRRAEAAVAGAFLEWCDNVAQRRRHRHRLASSRLWSARRRSRSC